MLIALVTLEIIAAIKSTELPPPCVPDRLLKQRTGKHPALTKLLGSGLLNFYCVNNVINK